LVVETAQHRFRMLPKFKIEIQLRATLSLASTNFMAKLKFLYLYTTSGKSYESCKKYLYL